MDAPLFVVDADTRPVSRPRLATSASPRAAVGFMLVVPPGRAVSMNRPRGLRLEVMRGRIWVTQSGRPEDRFLTAGDTLTPQQVGQLVLEADTADEAWVRWDRASTGSQNGDRSAPDALSASPIAAGPPVHAITLAARALGGPPSARWRRTLVAAARRHVERRQRVELAALDDRLLRDAGIPDALSDLIRAERAFADSGAGRLRWITRCTW
jgi:uncharacterized protein YjiS (DUF1127 family)